MLSQRNIQLLEGYSSHLVSFKENVDTKAASCSAPLRVWKAQLLRRRRVRLDAGCRFRTITIVCSQGIQALPVELLHKEENFAGLVRAGDGGANQLCFGADNVILAPRSSTGNTASDARPANNFNDAVKSFVYEDEQVEDSKIIAIGDSSTDLINRNSDLASRLAKVSLRAPEPISDSLSNGTLNLDSSSSSAIQDQERAGDSYSYDPQAVQKSIDRDLNAFEKFARARAAGKELSKRRKGNERILEPAHEDEEYYHPKVGDYVMGTVVSGTFGKLDINIGARKLGHLFRKDVIPLDICNVNEISWELPGTNSPENDSIVAPTQGPRVVYDDEVLNLALEAPMPVEVGTVLTMQVKGQTPSGRTLLSARSVARKYAWQRVRQLKEQNVPLEIQITEWTPAGFVSKVEGLRAFLPAYYLVRRPPESTVSFKDYVGQRFLVMISSIDEKRSNLVVSEKKAWMTKNAYIGALVEGIVTEIKSYGVHIRLKNTDLSGVLHISNISRARIHGIEDIFTVGEEVKAMVVPSNINRRLSFSTSELEVEDGLMIRDKGAVYKDAEKIAERIAKAYKKQQSELSLENTAHADVEEQNTIIANWDWLDFGDRPELDE